MRIFQMTRGMTRLRSAAIFLAVVFLYALVRVLPVVGTAVRAVEHVGVVAGTSVGNVLTRIVTGRDTTTRALEVCTARLQDITTQEASLRQELRNVTELETLLGYVRSSSTVGIAARITSRSLPDSATVTIDQGSDDGIREGAAVVVGNGQLFGTIVAVNPDTAIVRLVHHTESKVPAAILGKSRTIGLAEGQSGSVLRMSYIPTDATVNEGDLVVTSGLDGALPANIVIGMVTSVIRQETAPFLEALIEPLYDPREWTNVLVVATP